MMSIMIRKIYQRKALSVIC